MFHLIKLRDQFSHSDQVVNFFFIKYHYITFFGFPTLRFINHLSQLIKYFVQIDFFCLYKY